MSRQKRYSTYLVAELPDGRPVGLKLQVIPTGSLSTNQLDWCLTQVNNSLEDNPNLTTVGEWAQGSSLKDLVGGP